MKDGKGTFNVLLSIEKHIEALKPLLPKQAMVCIGEYPIKTLLKEPTVNKDGTLPILIEKSSEDIYSWIPKGFDPFLVLGFEDAKIDTHFWYNVQQTVARDNSIIEALKKKPVDKLHSAIIFSSIWDGVGSASLPSIISKFKAATIDSLSIAVMPSKIQPPDAHFNAYAALQLCMTTEGSTVLLLDRDQVEGYEGVDRKGELLKGNMVINYLLNLFLAKDSLVSEISELSRTFNVKFFSGIVVTGASYKIYGSFENMLNTAWLKPLLSFDLPSASLLYVLIRMPANLKEQLSRAKIELAIANWFKEKTSFQSVYLTEPIYTDDMTDRIDAVLFVGGFDTAALLNNLQRKIEPFKNNAVEKGVMTEDWQLIAPKVEEEPKQTETPETIQPAPPIPETPPAPDEPKPENEAPLTQETAIQPAPENAVEAKPPEATAMPIEPAMPASTIVEPSLTVEPPPPLIEPAPVSEEPKTVEKPKKARNATKKAAPKKAVTKRKQKIEKVEEQKKEETSA